MSRDRSARNVQVGLFIAITALVLAGLILVLGRTESLFSRKAVLNASFDNAGGLVIGAPVRLAGINIGIVQTIRFEKDLKIKTVHVSLGVERRYLERIRKDSVAHLSSKGLLGDEIINITVGSAGEDQLSDGDSIKSAEAAGLTEVIDQVREAITNVKNLSAKVDERLSAVLTDDVARDVGRIAHSTANVLEKVEKGGGLVHRVVYDPQLARSAGDVVDHARGIAGGLERVVGRADRVVATVETGDGTLHALLYGKDGGKLLADAAHAMREIDGVVAELKTGRGLLHSLVYTEDKSNLIENLSEMSRILRTLAEDTSRGKGTIGALLRDPSVYEDLKVILGNVRRNKLLRALVRYTIEKDQIKAPRVGATPQ